MIVDLGNKVEKIEKMNEAARLARQNTKMLAHQAACHAEHDDDGGSGDVHEHEKHHPWHRPPGERLGGAVAHHPRSRSRPDNADAGRQAQPARRGCGSSLFGLLRHVTCGAVLSGER